MLNPMSDRYAHAGLKLMKHMQVCHDLAGQAVWQTRSGQVVQLHEGCFLEASESVLGAIGAAAMAFIQRAFPIFVAPWSVKLALEAAGVPNCQAVTPATVRCQALETLWNAYKYATVSAGLCQSCSPRTCCSDRHCQVPAQGR